MDSLVFRDDNGEAATNSLLVANKFGKEHKHVLDAIREILKGCAENSADPMFAETAYVNEQNGQQYPMFIMNRDGFTLLAMGFTGKKAMKFKLDYIAAFNAMEKALKEKTKPLSHLEILVQSAQALLEQSRRIDNIEKRLDSMAQEREENGKLLLAIPVSTEKIPEMSLRDKIRQMVNRYSSAHNVKQQDVWRKIYDQLYYLYHISIRSYKKKNGESNLDIAEKHRFIEYIYNIISNMIREKGVA